MAFGKRRYHHAVDSQILQTECRTDDIHDRVNRTDFMEMNLADRDSMCLGLCLRHNLKHPARQVFNAVRCIQTIDDLENIVDVAVNVGMHMIMSVLMLMTVCIVMSVFMGVMMVMVILTMAVLMRMQFITMAVLTHFLMTMCMMVLMVVLIMAMFMLMMMLFLL